jgi:hypothetical protein
VLYARIIVGIALLLMAAFGPGPGLRRVTHQKVDLGAIGHRNAALGTARGVKNRDQKLAAVLILRILAAMLGLWMLIFSLAQLLHGHGHL